MPTQTICTSTMHAATKKWGKPIVVNHAKLILQLIFVACLSTVTFAVAHAETNVTGVEIIIDTPSTPYENTQNHKNIHSLENNEYFTRELNKGSAKGASSESAELQSTSAMAVDDDLKSSDLWQRIKAGYAMQNNEFTLTNKHEEWYSSRPEYISRMIERSQKYLFHIVEEVEKRNMPMEIALLPMIESAYNPQAYSRSHAAGIWQFIPSTGRYYGLKQNWWVDHRKSVTVATDAALDYLQKLHKQFGDWNLALAAYNAGEGTVARAIARNRQAGLATDYASLNLSSETKNYVPKLQAIKNIISNPSHYGLVIQSIPNTPYFSKVNVATQIDAHLAAKLANISDEEFLALNPSYNRPVISHQDQNNKAAHELLLPVAAVQTFETNLASYTQPLVSWKTYNTKRGENIANIAKKFGMQLSQLLHINDLPSSKKIKNSSTILVSSNHQNEPTALNNVISQTVFEDEVKVEKTASSKAKKSTYTVKRGDTLYSIANKFNVGIPDLKKWNKALSSKLKPGKKITIHQ